MYLKAKQNALRLFQESCGLTYCETKPVTKLKTSVTSSKKTHVISITKLERAEKNRTTE
jgi:hypothetical protein